MQDLARTGIAPATPPMPEKVRAIREGSDLSLYVFADLLNSTARLPGRYEQGMNRPAGPVLCLLHTIREQGMRNVFPHSSRARRMHMKKARWFPSGLCLRARRARRRAGPDQKNL